MATNTCELFPGALGLAACIPSNKAASQLLLASFYATTAICCLSPRSCTKNAYALNILQTNPR